MTEGQNIPPASGRELLEAGEAALERGDSKQAFALLQAAAELGVETSLLQKLAQAFARAGRFQSRQLEVNAWIEQAIAHNHEPSLRVALLHAQITVYRQLNLSRVEELAAEALKAAETAADEDAYASICAHASYAAYRRGDARTAGQYMERVRSRTFTSLAAQHAALRVQMFAFAVAGDMESVVSLTQQALAMARLIKSPADIATESNNLAECYLELGFPHKARECAEEAIVMASASGHRSMEIFGRAQAAMAMAHLGQIDDALETFEQIESLNNIFAVDTASAHAYWLLERNAAGDAERACEIAKAGIEHAERVGVDHRLTPLYSNLARGCARQGKMQEASQALEKARQAADRAELASQLLLALAVAEVLPVTNPKRKAVINHARARILRKAERRSDPWAYCTEVRWNRRVLELSGGVPSDLPRAT